MHLKSWASLIFIGSSILECRINVSLRENVMLPAKCCMNPGRWNAIMARLSSTEFLLVSFRFLTNERIQKWTFRLIRNLILIFYFIIIFSCSRRRKQESFSFSCNFFGCCNVLNISCTSSCRVLSMEAAALPPQLAECIRSGVKSPEKERLT